MYTRASSIVLTIGMLFATLPLPLFVRSAHAQTADESTEKLLLQARAWQQKGRTDKAVDAYKKVLRVQPGNVEALEAVGVVLANGGKADEARKILRELERVAPGSSAVSHVQAALRVGKDFEALLAEARAAVRAGKLPEAIAAYERAFGGLEPPARVAVEFYQTVGGTEQGWERARAGLDQHVKQHPADARAALAYAQHLTYREPTRREGIERLQALSAQGESQSEARVAWRKALGWLHFVRADAALVRAYVAIAGPDAELEAKLAAASPGASPGQQRGNSLQAGFDALERSDIQEASRQFERAGDVPDALVGLAIVAMRKDDFELAVKLLERAAQRAPNQKELWEHPLRSARFWQRVRKAELLVKSNRTADAEVLLREAEALSPEESHHALIALAAIARRASKFDDAERLLAAALARQPSQSLVERALVDLRLETSNFDGAIEVNAQLVAHDPAAAWPPAELEGEILRRRAAERAAHGELLEARQLLDSAALAAPASFWVLHDLVNVTLELGDTLATRDALVRLLEISTSDPAARILRARVEADAGNPELAIEVLAGLPDETSNGGVGSLRRQVAMRAQVDRVVRESARKGPFGARRELNRLEHDAGNDSALLAIVALGHADIGDVDKGITLIQTAIARSTKQDTGLQLQLAAVYLRAHLDAELRDLLEELATNPNLTPRARADLSRLHVAFVVSSSDKLSEAREYERALALLDPLLVEYPTNPALLSGLGRLLMRAGRYDEAQASFELALRQDADHMEAREGAVNAAQARNQTARAKELIDEGLERNTEHPRIHLIAARYALSQKDDSGAMRELEQASELALKTGGVRPRGKKDGLPTDASGLLKRARGSFAGPSAAVTAAEGKALTDTIDSVIADIRARHSIVVSAQPELRYRAGEAGLGRILELRTPFAISAPLAYFGFIEFGVEAVVLKSGNAAIDRADVAARFGGLGSVSGVAEPRGQDDAGIAPVVRLSVKDILKLSVGTTPLGFLYHHVTGSLRVRKEFGKVSIALVGSREPVKDSLLSYAGTTDPLSGKTWGAVLSQGGALELGLGVGAIQGYLQGGFYVIDGHSVAGNRTGRVQAGLSSLVYDWNGHTVSLGGSLLVMGYTRNLSGFTLGHAGYFSPQRFVRGGVPLRWGYLKERLRSSLEVDPGLNWFRRGGISYYPLSTALQQSAEAAGVDARYDRDQLLGFSMNLLGELNYELGNRFDAGCYGRMHFANDYEEYRAGVTLSLRFHKRLQARSAAP